LEEYDPSTNTWTTKASCSVGRHQINGCAVINNKMFFMGGKNNIQSIWYQTNESYDPITNTWSTYSNLPSVRWAGAAAVLNNEIHYLGGSNGNPIPNYNNHFVYNSSTDSWSNALSMLHDKETP